MPRELYELVGANDRRFSPYCWRARLALAHKGLTADTIAVGFTDKDKVAFSGQELVPVLRDGDEVICDSWDIACYLEDRYPDAPSLFGGAIGRAQARFFNAWAPTMSATIMPMIVKDIHDRARPEDQAYFRQSRETRFGRTLEEIHAARDAQPALFAAAAAPLRAVLGEQPFLCGETPAYADYIVFGSFQTARLMSPVRLVAPGDVIHDWRERMLDLFDGMARAAPACGEGEAT
ncbi:MAG: glutathione S-transferase N-terminal domain-containing protein [Alphaproteobacteria bacterium]